MSDAPAPAPEAAASAAKAPLVPETEYDVGLNRDGDKVKDPSYYRLLGVLAAASDAELKKAYRKQSLRWHPDKNVGNPDAQAKFQEISEAYTILSDSNSRAVYDKYGKSMALGEAGGEEGAMPDPGQLFSQMFGGKAFEDWIGEISLGKEVSKAFAQADAEEEEAEASKTDSVSDAAKSPPQSTLNAEAHSGPAAASAPATGVSPAGTAPTGAGHTAESVPASAGAESGAAAGAPGGAAPPGADEAGQAHQHRHHFRHHNKTADAPASAAQEEESKKPQAATAGAAGGKAATKQQSAEQRQKAYEEEKKSWEEKRQRVETLAKKLRERVRPFVEATKPGDKDDVETKRFAERMREEARDLAMESFGVELCHLLGEVYMAKATTYIRLHKKPSSNLLGLPGWWSRIKEKGTTLKEGWSFLSTGLDVQRAMLDMEKRQEKGELDEEEQRQLEEELSGTLLLVAWKGSKFELSAVLRQVVDLALSKESPEVTDAVLMNRAKAILFIGAILKAVSPEEGDDERRELERLVAQANARRKEKKHKKDKAAATTAAAEKTSASSAAPSGSAENGEEGTAEKAATGEKA